MTFNTDATMVVPEFQAATAGEVAATVADPSKGGLVVAQALQNAFAMKQGALVWDYYGPSGAPLNQVADRFRRYRSKTPIQAGLATSINNSAAEVWMYVERTAAPSIWRVRVNNLTSGDSVGGEVNGAAVTTGAYWLLGTIELDDTNDFNEFEVECYGAVGTTAADFIHALSIIPRRSFPAGALPERAGGYLRDVNPIDTDRVMPQQGVFVDVLRDMHAMALDTWKHRTGQILSSSYGFVWSGLPAAYALAHRFVHSVPAGVTDAIFFFYNGSPASNRFKVELVADAKVSVQSPITGPNSWTGVSVPLPTPRWGGDIEFRVFALDDFEACSAWFDDADYGVKGL